MPKMLAVTHGSIITTPVVRNCRKSLALKLIHSLINERTECRDLLVFTNRKIPRVHLDRKL
ncbi:hypothetical protein GQ44DRAFT_715388, partial [Phaeosphaeriaceae sp. PMI808]